MNEQTQKLIEQLAAKLGTTTEYLWGVLLKQAPIEATTCLITLLIAWSVVLFFGWRAVKNFKSDDRDDEDWGVGFTILGTITCLATLIITLNSLPMIISGFLNPEYWALKQILP